MLVEAASWPSVWIVLFVNIQLIPPVVCRQTDRQIPVDRQMDGWMDGWMDRKIDR